MTMSNIIAWGMPSMGEWLVIAVIGLLLFGKRLPEVGKSLGKGIVEFKKGLKGIEDDVDIHSNAPPPRQELPPERPAYRQPLAESGEDRRVSRADVIDPPRRDAR